MVTYCRVSQIASRHSANIGPMQHAAWGHCHNPNIGPTSFCTKSTPLGQRHWANAQPTLTANVGPMQHSALGHCQNPDIGPTSFCNKSTPLGKRHWANAQPTLTANVDPMQHSAWSHCQNPDIGPTSFCTKSTSLGQRHWANAQPTLTANVGPMYTLFTATCMTIIHLVTACASKNLSVLLLLMVIKMLISYQARKNKEQIWSKVLPISYNVLINVVVKI